MSLKDMAGETEDGREEPRKFYLALAGTALLFIILIVVLLRGCPSCEERIMYVCYTGLVVTDAEFCPPLEEGMGCNCIRNQSIINQTISVVKYVCFNGSIVDNIGECPPPLKCIPTTSTTTSSTTTTSIKSDINCRKLGCPRGTLYVGSRKTMLFYDCKCYYPRYMIPPDELVCFRNITEAYNFQLGNKTMEPCEYCDFE